MREVQYFAIDRSQATIVVSMHLVRLLCVLLFGPWLVKFCARPVVVA